MVGVVLIHVTSMILREQAGIALVVNQFARFAVPVYVFISGFGLTGGQKYKKGYSQFLEEQLSKLLPMYFLWSFIYYLINMDSFSFSELIRLTLHGDTNYHLYFVPLIIGLYVIYPLLVKVVHKKWFLPATLAVSLVTIHVGTTKFNPMTWLFFFSLGIWLAFDFDEKLAKMKQHKNKLITIYVAMLVYICVESFITDITTSSRYTVILYTVTFIAAVLSIDWSESKVKKPLSIIAKYSFTIYLCHPAVLKGFRIIYDALGLVMPNVIYIGVEAAIVLVIALMVAVPEERFMKKSKQLNK